MNKPIAVLISDIHFNLNTLSKAKTALESAISLSNSARTPLIIAGDLHDTKAIIRAEVANVLCEILKQCTQPVYIMVGNHDLINEKGKEHGLNYLQHVGLVKVIDKPYVVDNMTLIPYQSSSEELLKIISSCDTSILIMHQGFNGAYMGDYIQDKTSIGVDKVQDFTVISGHYHKHQTLGTVTYIGSPYSITFGEANDGPKGFLVLHQDGSFERILLDEIPKHVVLDWRFIVDSGYLVLDKPYKQPDYDANKDLIWLKLRGTKSVLDSINKKQMSDFWFNGNNFKLELIPDESEKTSSTKGMTNEQIFDTIIDNTSELVEQKTYLKSLWRELIQ